MMLVDDPELVADLRASVREVVARECPIERVRNVMCGGDDWRDLWTIAIDLGWVGLAVPERHGGLGLGLPAQAQVAEELGYGVFAAPLVTTMIAATALASVPGEPPASTLLEAICEGAVVAVAAGATLDAPDGALRAPTVLDGPRATSLVLARGETLCVVEALPIDACQGAAGVDLARPTAAAVLRRESATPTGGPAGALWAAGRVLLGAELVGVARRALDIAVAYAGERRQFGRRIGEFQGVKHRLADRAVDLIRARALVHEAAARPADGHATAMAKAVASGTAIATVKTAIQVTGAVGTTAEHELPWLLRRARHGAQVFGDERALYAAVGRELVDGTDVSA
jgi:alkylation response protein AidB-like acyl-CoA dehydrogenase